MKDISFDIDEVRLDLDYIYGVLQLITNNFIECTDDFESCEVVGLVVLEAENRMRKIREAIKTLYL
ncbi:MAG: hypothetical protein DRH11_12595 [Deltaproteobacteria bacterium]|nr:MAG: hypothetical protein DRH11_12595 [Deltaproteobacteria bacterium]